MTLDRKHLNVLICTGPLHLYSILRDDVVCLTTSVRLSFAKTNSVHGFVEINKLIILKFGWNGYICVIEAMFRNMQLAVTYHFEHLIFAHSFEKSTNRISL